MQRTHFAVLRNVNVRAQELLRAGVDSLRSYHLRAGVTGTSLIATIIRPIVLGGVHILAYLPGSVPFFETWNRINQTRANYFHGSQASLRQLGAALDLKGFAVSKNLRFIRCGGPLPAALRGKIADTSSWRYVYGYSMTEMGTICTTDRHITTLSGGNLVGPTTGGIVQIRSEDGEVIADGIGEIWVANDRGYDGYITLSGLDRSAKTGIWHRTGDLGRLDAEGHLYVIGRIDDMINIEIGRTVSPTALEEMLELDDRVASSAILPCSDRQGGTQMFAFIAAPGVEDEEEIREALVQLIRREAGDEFVPYRWSFLHEIPATPRGKVDRRALAAMIPEELKPERLG